jgi:hypothetical protein
MQKADQSTSRNTARCQQLSRVAATDNVRMWLFWSAYSRLQVEEAFMADA